MTLVLAVLVATEIVLRTVTGFGITPWCEHLFRLGVGLVLAPDADHRRGRDERTAWLTYALRKGAEPQNMPVVCHDGPSRELELYTGVHQATRMDLERVSV